MSNRKKRAKNRTTILPSNAKKELQMAIAEPSWFDGQKFIPLSRMTDKHLANAKLFAQRKELFFHNRSGRFSELVEQLEDEALKRGIALPDHNTEFHRNTRKLKQSATVEAATA